jgi:predicted nucleotidyltransferase
VIGKIEVEVFVEALSVVSVSVEASMGVHDRQSSMSVHGRQRASSRFLLHPGAWQGRGDEEVRDATRRIETAWRNHDPPRLFARRTWALARMAPAESHTAPRLDALVQVRGIAGLAG